MDVRTAEEREGAADAAASPTVVTRRCVWRGRGGTKQAARRCAAPREKSEEELAPLVLPCTDARPDPRNAALFPFSRQIYHRAYSPLSRSKRISDASKIDTSLILKVWIRSSRGV